MSAVYARLYVHLVWATKGRRAVLDPLRAARVHGLLGRLCRDRDCVPIAIGGVEDHVHVLVGLHPSTSVADLVRDLKVATSPFIKHTLRVDDFAWQAGYGVFSVRDSELEIVQRYVVDQRSHHTLGTTIAEWERCRPPSPSPTKGP